MPRSCYRAVLLHESCGVVRWGLDLVIGEKQNALEIIYAFCIRWCFGFYMVFEVSDGVWDSGFDMVLSLTEKMKNISKSINP